MPHTAATSSLDAPNLKLTHYPLCFWFETRLRKPGCRRKLAAG